MLVLPYMLNSPKVIVITNTSIATTSTTFNSILLYFPFYYNLSSKYVTR